MHLEGIIRDSEKPSSFVPDNSPSKAEWYWLDVPAMAKAAGLPSDTPMIEVGSTISKNGKAGFHHCGPTLKQAYYSWIACRPALQYSSGDWIISACSKEVQLPVDGSAEGSGMGLMA